MTEADETIAYCHACGTAMDVSAVAPFTNVECPKCAKHTRVKREFGPYTLVRRHAVGGMSMVFAAHDNTLDREVALKILSEDYSADERRIAAFEEEARLTASFSHPNVVRVLRTGRAFGRYYIAMEFVPGGHFEHHIRERGVIPEKEMLPLAIEVVHGLKAAHAAGLIHRDVKPGNILLDSEGHAKLVDFGLALVTQGGKARASEMWATPYYVPPETVEGMEEDFRSDIYAFGATLYHALAGKPPCNEESMATDILREAKKKVIPLQTANPEISAETCRLVARAMAYEPGARFGSYDELIAALNSSLSHLKSGATASLGTAAKRRTVKKRKEMIGLAIGISAVVSASIFALVWTNRKKPVTPVPPVTPPVAQQPTTAPDADNARTAEIARTFRTAQSALEAKDYQKASDSFMPLFRDTAVQEPTRSWAGVQGVVTKLLGGHLNEARKLAPEVIAHLRTRSGQADIGPAPIKALEQLPRYEPAVVSPAADSSSGGASQVMACMIAGIKNWEQGMPDQAAKCFASASTVTIAGNDGWAAIYQKLATDYMIDYQTLSGALFSEGPSDKAGCDRAVRELEGVLGSLKTQGRAHFNVRAWQTDLKRTGILMEIAKKQADSEKTTTPAPAKPPTLAEVEQRLAEFSKNCQFTEAAAYLKALPADPPGASRTALLTLAESAAVFIDDLEEDLKKEPATVNLRLKSGETLTSLACDSSGKITATPANEAPRPCQWADFPADSLIELHRLFVKNPKSDFDRVRRNECAIAYGWLAGNRALALAAATNLSQTHADFKSRWEELLKGLPK